MDINLLKKNFAFTATPEIIEICNPLRQLGITYFSFIRYYSDKSHIRFCTHADWLEYYYQKKFYNLICDMPSSASIVPWSCLSELKSLQDAAKIYNIANGVMIFMRTGDTMEAYSIGSTRENKNLNNFYLNNTDILYKFILFFKEKAFSLIKEARKNPIFLPESLDFNSNKSTKNLLLEKFLEEIEIKKVSVTINSNDFQISKKEAQILALTKSGFSAKEISNKLDIKLRTVDIYSSKIKEKLFQYTKSGLLNKIDSNPLIDKRWLIE